MSDDRNDSSALAPNGPQAGLPAEGAPTVAAAPQPVPEDIGTHALGEAVKVAFIIMVVVLIALAVFYVGKSTFTVQTNEVAIKLRFGRPVKVGGSYVIRSDSGYHFCWPFEEKVKIKTNDQTLAVDTEFMAKKRELSELEKQALTEAGKKLLDRVKELDLRTDGFLMTGDANIVHLKVLVYYNVRQDSEKSVLDHAFALQSPEGLLRRFAVQSTIETVGSWDVYSALLNSREDPQMGKVLLKDEIADAIKRKLRGFEKSGISAGIEIVGVELVGPSVPQEVKGAFEYAQLANERRGQYIQEAYKEARSITERARADAERFINEAQSYRTRLVEAAKADANMLLSLKGAYGDGSTEEARILRAKHYQRMVQEIFGPSRDTFVIHRAASGSSQELRLMFSPVSSRLKSQLQQLREERANEQRAAGEQQKELMGGED
jgi:regulator of protease activity HflC (stomatin/prohibitin superfamily)